MAKKKSNKKNNSYNFVPQPKKNAVSEEVEKVEVADKKAVAEEVSADSVVEVKETKKEKVAKTKEDKKGKKDKKKEKKPSRIVKGMKEIGSELKKVSWPKFKKVAKKTGVVIGVVLIFTAILFGIDRLASLLYTLLAKSIG